MINSPRCLYSNSFIDFINEPDSYIFGVLNDNYHGDARTTTR